MTPKFTRLDEELHAYVVEHGARQDDALSRVARETEELGDVSVMQISPDQGALLTLLVEMLGARSALELGTFTGYSGICIARGLAPGGRLVTCEIDEQRAEVALRNFELAGVADRVELRLGPALDTLESMPPTEEFEFAFIDADKDRYVEYYEAVLARMRPGGLVMVDNVLRGGAVVDAADESPGNVAVRRLNRLIAGDERVDVAMLAVADGITLARKR